MDKFREISELNLFFSYRYIKGYAQLSAEVIEGIDKIKSKKFVRLIDIYLWALGLILKMKQVNHKPLSQKQCGGRGLTHVTPIISEGCRGIQGLTSSSSCPPG